jgi:hypothetical protein
VPHVVVRIYPDAGPLTEILKARLDEVRGIMSGVPGFRSYGLLDTGGGIVSVTSAESKDGTDESSARAAEWVIANSPEDVKIPAPQITEGEGIWRFEVEGAPEAGAHVAVRIFSAPPPDGLRERQDDIRELMTAVHGFYSYGVIDTESGGGISIVTGKDKETTDEVGRRMRDWVRAQYPDFSRPQPQIIEGESLIRFTAQATPA